MRSSLSTSGSFASLDVMSRWSIGRVREVPPTPGSDCTIAFALHFREDEQPEPQIVVEYAEGAEGYASMDHARRLAARYLNEAVPPSRLVVDRDGIVMRRTN
jgi:hypothetical protein